MDKIGRLRALEKDIASADRLLGKSRKLDPDVLYGRVFINHRETILSLIAELGQEVVAVAWQWRWLGDSDEGPGPWNLCDNEAHSKLIAANSGYEVRSLYTSPAHTSEARDAGLLDALREIYEWEPYDAMSYGARRLAAQALNDYDAAMRQEAGSRE